MSAGFDDDDLRDARLRRALAHAPDNEALPEARTREAILKMAHNLAAATPPAAANVPAAQPWWRRLFGGGEAPARMPWNAAFATLLVVGFVTVLWRQEPVPDARLDGEARVGGAVAEAPPAPREAPAVVPEARPEAAAPVAPSGAAAEAAGNADTVRRPSAPAAAAQRAPAPQAERRQAPAEPVAKSRESASLERAAPVPATPPPAVAVAPPPPEVAAAPVAPAPPPPAAVAPPPAAVAPPPPSAPAPVIAAAPPAPGPAPPVADAAPGAAPLAAEQSYKKSESERASVRGAASALQSVPPALSYAPPQPSAAAPSAQLSQAESAALPAPSRARLAGAAAPAVERAPSFAALDRWTAWSAAGDTAPRHGRADIEAFPALLGAVARSATQPDAALAAPVEARIALYRGRTLVALLEIAGDQVRWSPQPGASAFIGTPPAQALASLRAALERATPSTPRR
ncbi:hypothetical protein [Variovorax sp.]|jgi:hypothetical protein|uniref:hypothetical protein n=1 Tax=Variovorax sp. TaxID=1871043 RepID=UPI0037D9B933